MTRTLDGMCEMRDERSLTVCDVAVERYRTAMAERLGDAVTFTHVDYQPTLVECVDASRLGEFQSLAGDLLREPA